MKNIIITSFLFCAAAGSAFAGKYCKFYHAPPGGNNCSGSGKTCAGTCITITQSDIGGQCNDGSLACTSYNLPAIVITTNIQGCAPPNGGYSGCDCDGTPTTVTSTTPRDC